MLPGLGHRLEVERVLRGVEDLEALRVGLHEAVLDPVVHHLHEMARARRADVRVPVVGCEGRERRLEERDGVVLAAHHQAVAVRKPPDPAGDAGVDVADPPLGREARAPLGVLEVGVAAVDDPGDDLAIPARSFGFGKLIRAQADGDLASLRERGRPIVRVKLEDLA